MANMKVENGFPGMKGFYVSGAGAFTHEINPPAYPITPNEPTIIQCEQDSHVHVYWEQSGELTSYLCGLEWRIEVLFEKWGSTEWSPSTPFSPRTVRFVQGPNNYSETITIPANTIPEGVYDIVVVLRLQSTSKKPLPLAGFVELNKVQVYEAA